ncbi:hypothetical protein NRB15_24970 [Pseudomonas alliivorans]|uniref:hypothetical protein n=1 Tax=Pseudomonas alliivorans TaxID=2810613 RepID=UPI00211CB0B3|nr:hypothetical protein [Pseudomonas alliivorans]MCQ9473596.1 hypothetical protein [Pseudomonas alliivorans]MEE4998107.1 hypothetical protein [Pseudomonas alliivorans]
MKARYIGKVVGIVDEKTVIVNVGEGTVEVGQTFLIVSLGPVIKDPDTDEDLEQLEIVRGRARVTHVQQKISTLTSVEVTKEPDVKTVTRSSPVRNRLGHSTISSFFPERDSVTESIQEGAERISPLRGATVGDRIIRAR